MLSNIFAVGVILALLAPMPAHADTFAPITLANLTKILIRFGILDIRKDENIDFYGKVTECKIYTKNYLDDFKWEKVRGALRESIRQNIATFPTGVMYDTTLQLGKYDFKDKLYRFSDKTSQFNVNVFRITVQNTDLCVKTQTGREVLPREFKFVLDQPTLVTGLPMSEQEGSALLARLKENKNKDLIIYTRFNMRIVYIPSLRQDRLPPGAVKDHQLTQDPFADGLRMDAQLDSIEYYEDEARTKLIYRYLL